MLNLLNHKKVNGLTKVLISTLAFLFFFSSLGISRALPQAGPGAIMASLPVPGQMVNITPPFTPVLIKGLKLDVNDPFKFNFIVEPGDSRLKDAQLKEEISDLVRYFLTALTVPESDLWVNLSPFENSRVITDELSSTDLGRDLLASDYILKQLVSSLTYPESPLGKKFWDKVYKRAGELYGTTKIPVNTFNKIWIMPESASIYENGNQVIISDIKLKVMLEADYLAMKNTKGQGAGVKGQSENTKKDINDLSGQIMKEVILPVIEQEVNQGKNFAKVRQITYSIILASWFKLKLKDSLVAKAYANKKTMKGVDTSDPALRERIYQQYVSAYKKGVYDYIKKEFEGNSSRQVRRRYYSGGYTISNAVELVSGGVEVTTPQFAQAAARKETVIATALVNEGGVTASPVGIMSSPLARVTELKGKIIPSLERDLAAKMAVHRKQQANIKDEHQRQVGIYARTWATQALLKYDTEISKRANYDGDRVAAAWADLQQAKAAWNVEKELDQRRLELASLELEIRIKKRGSSAVAASPVTPVEDGFTSAIAGFYAMAGQAKPDWRTMRAEVEGKYNTLKAELDRAHEEADRQYKERMTQNNELLQAWSDLEEAVGKVAKELRQVETEMANVAGQEGSQDKVSALRQRLDEIKARYSSILAKKDEADARMVADFNERVNPLRLSLETIEIKLLAAELEFRMVMAGYPNVGIMNGIIQEYETGARTHSTLADYREMIGHESITEEMLKPLAEAIERAKARVADLKAKEGKASDAAQEAPTAPTAPAAPAAPTHEAESTARALETPEVTPTQVTMQSTEMLAAAVNDLADQHRVRSEAMVRAQAKRETLKTELEAARQAADSALGQSDYDTLREAWAQKSREWDEFITQTFNPQVDPYNAGLARLQAARIAADVVAYRGEGRSIGDTDVKMWQALGDKIRATIEYLEDTGERFAEPHNNAPTVEQLKNLDAELALAKSHLSVAYYAQGLTETPAFLNELSQASAENQDRAIKEIVKIAQGKGKVLAEIIRLINRTSGLPENLRPVTTKLLAAIHKEPGSTKDLLGRPRAPKIRAAVIDALDKIPGSDSDAALELIGVGPGGEAVPGGEAAMDVLATRKQLGGRIGSGEPERGDSGMRRLLEEFPPDPDKPTPSDSAKDAAAKLAAAAKAGDASAATAAVLDASMGVDRVAQASKTGTDSERITALDLLFSIATTGQGSRRARWAITDAAVNADSSAAVRIAALKYLGALNNHAALPALNHVINDIAGRSQADRDKAGLAAVSEAARQAIKDINETNAKPNALVRLTNAFKAIYYRLITNSAQSAPAGASTTTSTAKGGGNVVGGGNDDAAAKALAQAKEAAAQALTEAKAKVEPVTADLRDKQHQAEIEATIAARTQREFVELGKQRAAKEKELADAQAAKTAADQAVATLEAPPVKVPGKRAPSAAKRKKDLAQARKNAGYATAEVENRTRGLNDLVSLAVNPAEARAAAAKTAADEAAKLAAEAETQAKAAQTAVDEAQAKVEQLNAPPSQSTGTAAGNKPNLAVDAAKKLADIPPDEPVSVEESLAEAAARILGHGASEIINSDPEVAAVRLLDILKDPDQSADRISVLRLLGEIAMTEIIAKYRPQEAVPASEGGPAVSSAVKVMNVELSSHVGAILNAILATFRQEGDAGIRIAALEQLVELGLSFPPESGGRVPIINAIQSVAKSGKGEDKAVIKAAKQALIDMGVRSKLGRIGLLAGLAVAVAFGGYALQHAMQAPVPGLVPGVGHLPGGPDGGLDVGHHGANLPQLIMPSQMPPDDYKWSLEQNSAGKLFWVAVPDYSKHPDIMTRDQINTLYNPPPGFYRDGSDAGRLNAWLVPMFPIPVQSTAPAGTDTGVQTATGVMAIDAAVQKVAVSAAREALANRDTGKSALDSQAVTPDAGKSDKTAVDGGTTVDVPGAYTTTPVEKEKIPATSPPADNGSNPTGTGAAATTGDAGKTVTQAPAATGNANVKKQAGKNDDKVMKKLHDEEMAKRANAKLLLETAIHDYLLDHGMPTDDGAIQKIRADNKLEGDHKIPFHNPYYIRINGTSVKVPGADSLPLSLATKAPAAKAARLSFDQAIEGDLASPSGPTHVDRGVRKATEKVKNDIASINGYKRTPDGLLTDDGKPVPPGKKLLMVPPSLGDPYYESALKDFQAKAYAYLQQHPDASMDEAIDYVDRTTPPYQETKWAYAGSEQGGKEGRRVPLGKPVTFRDLVEHNGIVWDGPSDNNAPSGTATGDSGTPGVGHGNTPGDATGIGGGVKAKVLDFLHEAGFGRQLPTTQQVFTGLKGMSSSSPDTKGGIDMNTAKTAMNIKGDGKFAFASSALKADGQSWKGITFTIVKVERITNPALFFAASR